jgi:hypothetical protein
VSFVIGLSIASDHLRAVGVRAGEVRWTLEAERSAEGDLASEIVTLLHHATLPRWPRPMVAVAIGPAASQTKRLTGLPLIADVTALRAVVRESASRFFLRNGVPLVVSGVRVTEPGMAWAAAFEEPVVQGVEVACRTLRLRVRLIAPTVVALPRGLRDADSIEWDDGAVRAELTIAAQAMTATRRVSNNVDHDNIDCENPRSAPAPRVVDALRVLGDDGWRFADAYGATQLPSDEPLALRIMSGDLDAGVSRRSIRVAAAALCIATMAAIVAPGLSSAVHNHRTGRELAALGARQRDAGRAERDLARMDAALAEVSVFDASRRSPTLLLASLAHALPETTVLVTVRIDSTGATIAILAPRAAAALAAVDSMAQVTSPEILGPVTKEVVGTRELERATMHFRFGTAARLASR